MEKLIFCNLDMLKPELDEDDYALNCFKNDIMAETEFNIGQKIVPILSSDFLEKFS